MSPILRIVDFFDEILSNKANGRSNMIILLSYICFVVTVAFIWVHASDQDFSFILSLAGGVQALAFFLLQHKIRDQKSAAGLSSKTLQLYVVMTLARLTSTLVKNGYLPVDSTGDWLYQAMDITNVVLLMQLLYYVHKKLKDTYQEELDSFPAWNFVPSAALLAVFVHGNCNHSFFYDTVWAFSLYLDTIALLPQLWMLVAKGGEVDQLTSHSVALIFLSRCLTFCFWWVSYSELALSEGGFNKAGFMIVGCTGVQVLLATDFMYHYFLWTGEKYNCGPCAKGRSNDNAKMVLPVAVDI